MESKERVAEGRDGCMNGFTDEDELLLCVLCRRLAADAVLLPCIHTACRSCLEAAVATAAAPLQARFACAKAASATGEALSVTAGSVTSDDSTNRAALIADGGAPYVDANGLKNEAAAPAVYENAASDGGGKAASASKLVHANGGSAFSPPVSVTSDATNSLGDSLNWSAASGSSLSSPLASSASRRTFCPRCPEDPVAATASAQDGPGSGADVGVEATAAAPVFKSNRHVAGRIRARSSASAPRRCSFCDDEATAAVAEYRCRDCAKFLCAGCRPLHDKLLKQHRVAALSEHLPDEAATAAAAEARDLAVPSDEEATCPRHVGRELAFTCSSCRDFRCVACVAACDTAGHRYMTLAVAARNARERVAALLPGLDERAAALDGVGAENGRRAAAHEALRAALGEQLQRNKRSLLDLGARAFDAARRDADDRLDAALDACGAAGNAVEAASCAVRRVAAYARSLLDGGDALSLVDQADVLADCTAALLRRAAVLAAADEVRLQVVSAILPNMADIVAYHVGQIRSIPESLSQTSTTGGGGGAHSRSNSQEGRPCSGLGGGSGGSILGELTLVTPFSFTAPDGSRVAFALQHVGSYKADIRCLDVAVGFDGGTILVSERGVRRYDLGGRQLNVSHEGCEYGSVTSHNGHRFAAWNYTRQRVEIFGRDGQQPVESLRAVGRVAVAEDGKLAAANGAGVTLFDADGQQLLHVDYAAHNDSARWLPPVAARHRSLVLALQPPSAGGGSAVVAFDYQGRQRWRVAVDEPVYGLCCDGWGNVFAALHDSGTVRALAADGRPLGDVLASAAHGHGKPWRVAISGDSRWLAVLAADKITVSIYANLIHVT